MDGLISISKNNVTKLLTKENDLFEEEKKQHEIEDKKVNEVELEEKPFQRRKKGKWAQMADEALEMERVKA